MLSYGENAVFLHHHPASRSLYNETSERERKRVYCTQSGKLSEQRRKQMMFHHRQLVSPQADGNMTQLSLEVSFIHIAIAGSHLPGNCVMIYSLKIYIVRDKAQRGGQATQHLTFYCTYNNFVLQKSLPVWLPKCPLKAEH